MSSSADEFDDLDLDDLDLSEPSAPASKRKGRGPRSSSALQTRALEAAALVGLVIGVATAALGGTSRSVHLVGYVLGSLLPISAAAFYRRSEERLAADQGRRVSALTKRGSLAVICLSLVVAVVQAAAVANTVVSFS